MADRQVVRVNGHAVLNLRQMYALVQRLHTEERFLTFELFCIGVPRDPPSLRPS